MVVAWLRRKAVRLGRKKASRDEPQSHTERVVSAGELAENNGQNGRPCWVAHGGAVYDVGAFLESHPGGASAIGEHGGRPIDAVFDAEHVHSSFARRVLEEHRVGVLGAPGGGERRSRLSFFRLASTTDLPGTKHAPAETLALGTSPVMDVRSRREGAAAMAAQATDKGDAAPLHADMAAARDDSFLDLSRPLFPQLLHNRWTKAHYLRQVHIPRHCAASPAFFANRWLNAATMMVWWAVPLTWAPVVVAALCYAAQRLPIGKCAALYALGAALWTLYEYVFHRFVFHAVRTLPDSRLLFALHFTVHGVHHLVPMDRMRLVMPPLLLAALAAPVTAGIRALGVPWAHTAALQAGTLSGYVAYDMLHYAFHHARIRPGSALHAAKAHHMDHHYRDPDAGFGVSSPLWDWVFRTDFAQRARPKLYAG